MRDWHAYNWQGGLAFRAGIPRDDNPFPAGSYAHEAFAEGWDSAARFAAESYMEPAPLKLKERPPGGAA